MSNPPCAARNHGEDGSNTEVENTMARSENVTGILKSLNPFNSSYQSRSNHKMESTLQEQHAQIHVTTSVEQNVEESLEGNVVESTTRVVEIGKGDTLWGLSRKYGVSIKAIKEANGLTSDIIYAINKLNIP